VTINDCESMKRILLRPSFIVSIFSVLTGEERRASCVSEQKRVGTSSKGCCAVQRMLLLPRPGAFSPQTTTCGRPGVDEESLFQAKLAVPRGFSRV